MLTGGVKKPKEITDNQNPAVGIPITPTNDPQRKNLQLKSFDFNKETPTPSTTYSNVCGIDDGSCHPMTLAACCTDMNVMCSQRKCLNPSVTPANGQYYGTNQFAPCDSLGTLDGVGGNRYILDSFCEGACGDLDGYTCVGKPVIYLYPTKPTSMNVSVKTSGKIVVSDPQYPNGGWKNVLANPNGNLVYQNKNYKELFYESRVKLGFKPLNGIIISTSDLKNQLSELVYQLGLTNPEKQEFLDWWVPRLNALNSPYILFSILDHESKEAYDHVDATPQPDTRIEFIAYFKPLDLPIAIDPLVLPARPERHGFTMVEWGGVIDQGQ